MVFIGSGLDIYERCILWHTRQRIKVKDDAVHLTRGTAPHLPFEDAMLTGLARDGGLYVPQDIPQMSRQK